MFSNWFKLNFARTIPPRGDLGKPNFVKTLSQGRISVAELHEDIPSERKKLRIFTSEQSCGSRILWRHSLLIRVAKAELREDIPFWLELLKLNFVKTFPFDQSCWSWTSWRHSLLIRVAEAKLREDIPFWSELLKLNFVKTFPCDQSCLS